MVEWLGIFNTVLQVLAGLFCGEFHKGFTAVRSPHCQAYIVSCMPGLAVSWSKWPAYSGKPRFTPIVKTFVLPHLPHRSRTGVAMLPYSRDRVCPWKPFGVLQKLPCQSMRKEKPRPPWFEWANPAPVVVNNCYVCVASAR